MADDLYRLLDDYVYDIRGSLETLLDSLLEDLGSGDEAVRHWASKQISEILRWTLKPSEAETLEDRRIRTIADLQNRGIPLSEAQSMAIRLSRTTGRPNGRPKVLGPYAIAALELYLKQPLSYRQIRGQLMGPCSHFCLECGDVPREKTDDGWKDRLRPKAPTCASCKEPIRITGQPKRVCFGCGEATRKAVKELKKSLRKLGIYPNVPRRVDLQKMSPEEIEREWKIAE